MGRVSQRGVVSHHLSVTGIRSLLEISHERRSLPEISHVRIQELLIGCSTERYHDDHDH